MTGAYQEVVPDKPGTYICVPRLTLHNYEVEAFYPERPDLCVAPAGVWIVEIFKHFESGLICYKHPTDNEDRVVGSASHKWYGPIEK